MNNNTIVAVENFRCTLCGNFLNVFPLRITDNNEKLCGRCPDIGKPTPWKALEDKVEHKSFPCSNENCKEAVSLEQTDHVILCTKRLYQCPVTAFGKCPYYGTRDNLRGHFRREHADFYHCADNSFSTDFGLAEEITRLFHNKEGDFLLTTKTDIKTNEFWFCVRFLGDALDANILYIYSLTFSNPDNPDEEVHIKNKRVNPNIILHITKPESALVKIDSTLSALREPYSKIVQCTLVITTGKKCKWNQCSEVQSIQDITGHETGCAFKEIKEKIGCFLVEKTISTEKINHEKAEKPQSTPKAITIKCRWCTQTFPVEHDLIMHENSCDMIPLPCEFCDDSFPIKQYADHETACSSRYNTLQRNKIKKSKRLVPNSITNEGLPKLWDHLTIRRCKFCMKKISDKELEAHENSCAFRVQRCPHCNYSFFGSNIKEHEIQCNLRATICTFCTKAVPFTQIYQHRTACINNYKRCVTCHEAVNCGQYEEHKKKCELKPVDQCKWCPLAYPRDTIQLHEKSCKFRKMVCPHQDCEVEVRFCDLDVHMEKCKHRDKTKYKCKLCNCPRQERHLLIKHLRKIHQDDFIEGDTCTRTSERGADWQRWYMLLDGELFRCKCNFWKDGKVSYDAHYEGQDANKAKDYLLRIKVEHLKDSLIRQQCLNKRSSRINGCVNINVEEVAHLVSENAINYVFTLTKIN